MILKVRLFKRTHTNSTTREDPAVDIAHLCLHGIRDGEHDDAGNKSHDDIIQFSFFTTDQRLHLFGLGLYDRLLRPDRRFQILQRTIRYHLYSN